MPAPGVAPAPFRPIGASLLPAIPQARALPTFDEMAAFQSRKRRNLMIAGAVAAVVVIAGIVLAFAGGGPEKPLPAAPAPEPPAAAPPASPPPAAPSPDSTAGSETAPAPDGAKSPPASAPLPGAAAGPGGGFADLFAEGAKQAQPGGNGRFDAGQAKTAIDDQLNNAARCREPGGPTGMTRVAVTFAPSGAVSSATISDAPFAGTSVGNCICEAMKQARIKPFTGVPQTVTQRVSIR
jgi:hypothetical protein